MVELPIKKFSANTSDNRFSCIIKSDAVSDDKVLKNLAKEYNCEKVIQYKDCFEHVMKYNLMFKDPEKKEAFLVAIINCKDLEICDKIKRRYA